MQLQILELSYSQWKKMRAFLSVNTYYIKDNENKYRLLLIDFGRGFISQSIISSKVDLDDFKNNIENVAVLETSIDSCIATQIVG